MKQLRKRFIYFNMLVITCIMIFLTAIVVHSGRMTTSRIIMSILIVMVLVFIGSWLLSKMAITPIKAAWQKQIDFTADASHELRTPLSTIQTNLDVVLSNPTATVESQLKWLKNIEAESKRMSNLVANLLLLSRADADEEIISIEDLNLSSLLVDVISPYDTIVEQKGICMNMFIKEDVVIKGDQDRMRQLIVILLDNAIKYTDSGGEIDISLSCDKNKVYLEISDTGIGIEQEEIKNIFNRYYRGKKSRLSNPDGSGLGLAIAKLITKEHGGTILVKSQVGEGSVFTVSLPVQRSVSFSE